MVHHRDIATAMMLALYRRHLCDAAMVQIPVMPLIKRKERWVGGHYGDEFAEAHGKELAVRSRLGLPLPSAGVRKSVVWGKGGSVRGDLGGGGIIKKKKHL